MSQKHNDWYEELCALACIGELSASEFEDLQAHLAECVDCRELHADFRRISADDLACVAVSKNLAQTSGAESEGMDEQLLLSQLLDRARLQRSSEISPMQATALDGKQFFLRPRLRRIFDWLRQPALSYGTVGLLFCAIVGLAAYRLREIQLSPALAKLHTEVNDLKGQVRESAAEADRASLSLVQSQVERDLLRKSLEEAEAKYAELRNEQEAVQAELAAERAQLQQKDEALDAEKNAVSEKSKEVAVLEARVLSAMDRTEQQRKIAESLQTKLDRIQEQPIATPEVQGFGDLEAKQLFGARDLHIVDVYDVDAKGNTKRTYGRVYYVEKKLLMLYAFDLENKNRNRAPASFQAWGYRQPNESKPESLGLFSMDDPSVNRWVLKVNNSRVLEHIDAVYVTMEAPKGSSSPTGKRLLYANLAGPANHP